ncbi:hypothetical protein KA078_02535 [Candidatus Woesebacteria bacterium]|nr:hypothetical protein [Candidatus Woesebacteria bacterium]
MSQPSFRPRPGGGFNQGLGQFSEHLDEQAMQQAVQQKAMGQQASSQTAVPTPPPGTPMGGDAPEQTQATDQNIFDTVVTAPVEAVGKTLLSVSGLDKLLGIKTTAPLTPEEQAKKKTFLQRYNQLDDQQQEVARSNYQRRLQEEKLLEQEEERRRQQEAAAESQPVMAQGKASSGAQGPGHTSKKQQMLSKMQNDRKTLSGPQSAG